MVEGDKNICNTKSKNLISLNFKNKRNKNKKRVAPKIKYIRILNFFSLKDIKRHTKLNPKIVYSWNLFRKES